MIARIVASNLRYHMNKSGMNMKGLAAKSEINYIQLRRYLHESEPTLPSDNSLQAIASALNITTEDLMQVKHPPSSSPQLDEKHKLGILTDCLAEEFKVWSKRMVLFDPSCIDMIEGKMRALINETEKTIKG
jgi:transcriptional regulator with XRE-family HTH domain